MGRRSQRHQATMRPYRYRGKGVALELDRYTTDDGTTTTIDLAASERTVDVAPGSRADPTSDAAAWDTVTLEGQVQIPEETIDDVVPPDERDAPPATLYVTVHCHETIYRDAVVVREAPTRAGEYDVTVRLDWPDVRSRVVLRPCLVRSERGGSADEYATGPNLKLAEGPQFEVIVDYWDDDPPAAIDGEEVSFSQTAHLPDGDRLYYLDFRNEARPKLWINADNPRIAEVLRSRGSVGAEPRTRDVILDQIGYGVWSQLIVRSVTAIDDDGSVDHEWQQTVLEAFGPELAGVDDLDVAKDRLRNRVRDPDGVARLVSAVDTELQTFLDPREQLINLMEEGLQI